MTHLLDAHTDDWQSFEQATVALKGYPQQTTSQHQALCDDFSAILAAGMQPRRHYHGIDHFRDIAQSPLSVDEMSAHCSNLQEALHTNQLMQHFTFITQIMTRAGWHHDIIYTQVDEGIHPLIDAVLKPFYQREGEHYRLAMAESLQGEGKPLYEMVCTVFGFQYGQVLAAHNGQNEFLSALYATLMGHAQGLSMRTLLAEVTMIEATIPFRSPASVHGLRERVMRANEAITSGSLASETFASEPLSQDEIEALLYGAIFMANHDVIGFRKPFEQFNRGSHLLLMESAPTLQTPHGMYAACTRIADFLSRVGKCESAGIASVFHSYGGFPATDTRDLWDRTAQINCEVQRERMLSYAAVAALVAAVASRCGYAQADEVSFDQLFSDASLEPPDHIFPRAMHELRLMLTPAERDALLGEGVLPPFFPHNPLTEKHLLDQVRPELIHAVQERLITMKDQSPTTSTAIR
ncbi:MAG: hypothetical protein K2Q12_09570 [Rickettsiales bacterium]|nr:hypothetical protein [Rickettsiales bacterium]